MKCAIYIILFLSNFFLLSSQEAVISEYYNDSDFSNEWTEILVTKDYVNLTNYVLRDNSERYNDGNFWQGGVRFNNNSLWKNLRSGTVIVINHRGTDAPDTDPSDGYLEVDAENTTYFSKYDWNGIASLSIQQYGDIIQLLNASGVNVHALAHVEYSSQGDFFKINGKKIAYVGNCSLGYSISVGNATKLSDYDLNITNQSGYDTGRSITLHSPGGTKGKANKNPKGGPVNYQFWQELRQPKFDKAFLKVKKIDSVAVLNWNTVNPLPKTNDYGGYIILKSTDLKNTVCTPQDGKEYYAGQKLCPQTYVLAVIKGLENNTFIDENPLCGTTTRYFIFAFNFGYDNNNWSVGDGRGVAYSDDLNESNYEDLVLAEPIDLKLFSTLGTKFCSMDTTVLFSSVPQLDKNKYKYAWYYKRDVNGSETVVVDFNKPGVADSLKVYRPGYYRLEIKDETGCVTQSDTLFIEIIEQPNAMIAKGDGVEFERDTTIYYCGELNYQIRSKSPFEDLKLITILKNGNITLNNSGEPYTVTEPGNYYYISRLEECVDTSVVVTFAKKPYNMTSSKSDVNFVLVASKPSVVDSLVLTNKSNEDYEFEADDFVLKKPFKILNGFPLTIPSHSEKIIYVEFAPTIDGKFIDTLNIEGLCDSEIKIALNGLKLKSNAALAVSLTNVDFGNLIQCTYNNVDTSITITNIGDEYIVMKELNGIGDFYVNPTISNDTLYPNQTFDIVVGSNSKKLGNLIGNFNIPWQAEGGIIDTLRFYAKAFIDIPKFEVVEDTVNFGQLSGCDDYLIDSVTFVNTGIFEIRLDDSDFIKGLEILNKPVVVPPGDTVVVYLKYSSKTVGKIDKKNSFKVIPGCGLQDDFWVLAETIGGGFKVEMPDTLDFGKFYSCQDIDSTQYLTINISDLETSEDINVTAELENNSFQILDKLGEITGSIRVPIRFAENTAGIYNSEIKFVFQPCNKERILYLKAEVISQQISLSDTVVFDTYKQGGNSTKQLLIKNTNPDLLVIDNINLPSDVTFTNAVVFPIKLKPDSTVYLDVQLSTLKLGDYLSQVEVNTSSPCDENYNITLKGYVVPTDIPPGNFIAQFGIDNQIASPKSVITVPVVINEDIYKFNEVNLNSLSLTINYPFEALMLKEIEPIQDNLVISSNDNYGRLTFKLEDDNKQLFNLTSNKICNLKFYVLDALPNTYKFTLDTGEVVSVPSMTIETEDSSFVEVTKNCVNTIAYVFTNPVHLTYSLDESTLLISLLQPTDDKYILKLYDNTGRTINELLDGSQGRGDYFRKISLSDFYSGVYYLVLYYPNNTITKQIRIIK